MDNYQYFFYSNLYSHASNEGRDALHDMNASMKYVFKYIVLKVDTEVFETLETGNVLHKIPVQGTNELY